jgi:hypothetical protein
MREAPANYFVNFRFTECNRVTELEHVQFSYMEISNGKIEYLFKKWLNIKRIVIQKTNRVSKK